MAQEKELTLEQALARIQEQDLHIEQLEADAAEATQLISELNEQLENAKTGQELSETVVVSHTAEDGSKEQYKVLSPKFQHKGQAYEAKDLKTNADLVKALVDGKSGILQKLQKPAAKAKKDASK
ncbi:hypothetical protein JAO73_10515 [Hymenobacter sp. BT523]|uniref:hypothetical protein n=1 Tax=Hymenobacter sp. BT523 TaxID=2795725 RepID=UPI0018ED7EA5|nr:hypothetical protein [Hymenobacter sp. BT523]MBJ6109448.1 hypothetical protein [Hymenobacter sp. BT523]